MKKNRILYYLVCSLALIGILAGCNNNTYSYELKQEKALIADYIQRQGIHVIEQDSMPTTWGEKDYWKVYGYDNLYFHLVNIGDTTHDAVEYKNYVNIRYREYTLDVYADTINMWNTNDNAYPVSLQYGYNGKLADNSCTAWQVAVAYMKYSQAECKLICPSKLGFTSTEVTPHGYDMKMQIKRY